MLEGARRRDGPDASVVNEAIGHSGIERHPCAGRFVKRRECCVSIHRVHDSVESHGGMSPLDYATAKAPSESQSRADIVCLVFCSSYVPLEHENRPGGGETKSDYFFDVTTSVEILSHPRESSRA